MGSVDLAFYGLWRKYFPDVEVRFWQLYTAPEQHQHRSGGQQAEFAAREVVPFEYKACRDRLEELSAGRAIIFWGDFLHMAHYRDQVARRLLGFGMAASLAEAIAVVDRHFFLAESPASVLGKTLAFGGNLLFNRASDRLNPDYENMFRRFALQARHIWMRDVFSARLVNRVRGDWTRSHLGADCALMLEDAALAAVPRRWCEAKAGGDDSGMAGIFFSRNRLPVRFSLAFARAICRALGVRARWLPWRKVRFPKWPAWRVFRELELPEASGPPSLADLVDLIGRCEFVITDTYHVCVNAWRLGKPAVCIGETWAPKEMDVSCGAVGAWRDKRWGFYAMSEALEFYIHAAELTDRRWLGRRAAETAALLQSRPLVGMIQAGIQEQAAAARQKFLDELFALIR